MTSFKSPLEGALYCASRGWFVIPLWPEGSTKRDGTPCNPKSPWPANWPENASNDPAKIEEWSRKKPGSGWGVAAFRSGMVVIDIDKASAHKSDGFASFEALKKEVSFPPTFTVRTPTGGLHLYYKATGIGSTTGFRPGIDIKGTGGQVVAPGTVIGGKSYEIVDDREPADLPSGLVLSKAAKSASAKATYAPASSDDFSVVIEEIRSMSPLPQGRRDDSLIAICLEWKERGMGFAARLNLLRLMNDLGKIEAGNDPLTDDDFRRINTSAEKKTSAVYGSRTLEATFGDAIEGAYSAADLPGMNLKPPEFLVDGLVPKGIGFIAGPPKFGKTFLNLQLGVSIASGTSFLGRTVPEAKRVLYLYLEGDAAQVYTRLTSIYGPGYVPPRDLIILHKCPPLDAGGRVVLKKLMERYRPDLTIFDTWQLIREDTGAKGQTAYMKEYRELENMREEIAEQYHTSILLTHHTKQVSSKDYVDALNRLNGSTALGGCSDYCLILLGTRGDEEFTLTAHGRNFEDVSIPLVREKPMRWVVSKDGVSPLLIAETDLQRGIVDVLTANPNGLKAIDIQRLLPPGTKANSVTQQLNRWYEAGKLDKEGKRFRLFQTEINPESDSFPGPPPECCHVSEKR